MVQARRVIYLLANIAQWVLAGIEAALSTKIVVEYVNRLDEFAAVYYSSIALGVVTFVVSLAQMIRYGGNCTGSFPNHKMTYKLLNIQTWYLLFLGLCWGAIAISLSVLGFVPDSSFKTCVVCAYLLTGLSGLMALTAMMMQRTL